MTFHGFVLRMRLRHLSITPNTDCDAWTPDLRYERTSTKLWSSRRCVTITVSAVRDWYGALWRCKLRNGEPGWDQFWSQPLAHVGQLAPTPWPWKQGLTGEIWWRIYISAHTWFGNIIEERSCRPRWNGNKQEKRKNVYADSSLALSLLKML